MANKKHLKLIEGGSKSWNEWRSGNPDLAPNLSGTDLGGADLRLVDLSRTRLSGADLSYATLSGADLCGVILAEADLSYATLSGAKLGGASLSEARVSEADLRDADLREADLRKADLRGADLRGAYLVKANLSDANLGDADLSEAEIAWTTFGDNDLSTVKGLETIRHKGPSTIGVDTLFKSHGKIPEVFLRGAGIPEDFITQIPSLIAGLQPIEFHSCFISYSHQDEEFSQRLHSRMRSEKLRVWYAPEDLKGGRKLDEEIFSAIQVHDKLLLVLSDHSMKSEWVMTEIRRARKVEREENRRKLFPIRLVDFGDIQKWECFDADSGKDLAVELREYYIPDFSDWKDQNAFETECAKLLRDLKATET